ncbi:allophanate hydrolase 2 subunit 1 [Gracilibacillus boraciitolerans JCM 21714]|uniref:Allophanate hydrolase 2 subunit 1 n=1 Tax=Gracilibacillus boraciitolerans JCM 21714 TaxID=1298598 RepID=W4VFS6_9BACI|nr:5-oxoprolinase subunit PxpB [Gracilibacillus boraciitolerans]GAE92047.1 allophanate hydrolase 2 subunit 1 [Gracilibacillus boraciitolerans JCM 21714]
MQYQSIAENAIILTFPDDRDRSLELLAIQHQLTNQKLPISETVLGYCTLTIYFDPFRISHDEISSIATKIGHSKQYSDREKGTFHRIPVCYDPIFGLDIDHVATSHQLTIEEVIRLHTSPTYDIAFLGFSPGFPFLTGMDKKLATNRKETPRREVSKGAVGIAGGEQTGVYPSASPGGWNIIGRTPIELLPLKEGKPTLFYPGGDQLSFYAISPSEFYEIYEEEQNKK